MSTPPPKPWERAGSSPGPTPFKPPSSGNTSDVVEASGTSKPAEIVTAADRNTAANRNIPPRPVPTRPWDQQQTYGSTSGGTYGSYGGYGMGMNGGGLYGNNMCRGSYGGMYGGGMNGGGLYNNSGFGPGFGGPMGGYGMGMGAPYGEQDPNNPFGSSSSSQGFWVSLMRVMRGVVSFFGRIAFLVDQNTQAFHMFMNALLQLFDHSGVLYGELARFVLRLLGIKTKPKVVHPPGGEGLTGPNNFRGNRHYIEGPKAAPTPPSGGAWDSVWGDNTGN